MKQDLFGCLVSERGSYPPNIGDSCAETARAIHLYILLGKRVDTLNLYQFVTSEGFVRHPLAPEKDTDGDNWREPDFSSDQALPLYLAARLSGPDKMGVWSDLADLLEERIKEAGWKTGNGDFVSPPFFAILKNWKWLLNLCLLVQILFFKFPLRWSDSKKFFELSKGSSADYLNFFHLLVYASPFVRRLVSKKKVISKISQYYEDEPNSAWLIELYLEVAENLFHDRP